MSPEAKKEYEKQILSQLKLDEVLPPTIIEKIESLEEDPAIQRKRDESFRPQHTRSDYAMLKDITVTDVFSAVSTQQK